MQITMLKSKIHRAAVTQAELDYVGSITIDAALMRAAGILEYEKVQVVDIDNGARFETYTIAGEENSGVVCLNGAAARCAQVGDRVIIMAYCSLDADEAAAHKPRVVFVDGGNKIARISNYEKQGRLSENYGE
ncbi:MAG: aspartate 1-decarboxylase [Firmicutes bacterium]|nr:aspartate 1-decarboxylase [Bacillota bacterium]